MSKIIKNIRNMFPPSKKSLNTIRNLIDFRCQSIENKIDDRFQLLENKLNRMAEQQQQQQQQLFWFSKLKPGESLFDTKMKFYKSIGCENKHFRNIQLIILSIMDFYNDICLQNNLKYWLWSGSLLGAVRHNGFIPWDEDADVGMAREDFNKLKELLKSHPRYELVDFYEIGIRYNSCGRFAKLVDKNCPYPIYLDVFPFDLEEVADHNEAAKKYYSSRVPLQNEIWDIGTKLKVKKESRPIEDITIKQQVDEIFDKYIPAEQCGTSLQWGLELFRAPYIKRWAVEDFYPLRKMAFENREFYVPNNYYKVLELSFKDWTSLPNDCYSLFHSQYFGFDDKDSEIENFVKKEGLKI